MTDTSVDGFGVQTLLWEQCHFEDMRCTDVKNQTRYVRESCCSGHPAEILLSETHFPLESLANVHSSDTI